MSNDTKDPTYQNTGRFAGLGLVTAREIKNRGLSKSNLVGVAITVGIVGVLSALPALISGDSQHEVGVAGPDSSDMQASLEQQAENVDTDLDVTVYDSVDELETAVEENDIDAGVIDGTLYVDQDINMELTMMLESAHAEVASNEQLVESGLDPAEVYEALNVAPLEEVSVGDGNGYDPMSHIVATTVAVMLMMTIMIPIMTVAMGVVEEKSSRIVEILLTSLKPWQLLGGKIVGLGVVGAFNVIAIAITALTVGTVAGTLPDMPDGTTEVLASVLIWWVLGFTFFAAMAGAAGSLVSRQEDSNSTLTPVTMLLVVAYMGSFVVTANPNGALGQTLSIVPPFSSITMPARMVFTDVPLREQFLAAGLLALAAIGMLYLGTVIYKRTVMRMGGRVKLMEALKS